MREIKFRVWDKENNQFFQPTYAAYKGELEDISIALGGKLLLRDMKHNAVDQSLFPDRFGPLQQYTGLKDSNRDGDFPEGIEIFENDILFDPIENNFFIVSYDESYANFFLKNIDESPDKPDYDFAEYDTDVCNSLYVVGNIYETPELLGESNVR